MDSGSTQNKCSCARHNKDTSLESDNSSNELPVLSNNQSVKPKKSKISLFDIKKARSQLPHFKRNKKTPNTGSSSSTSMSLNLLKKYPRWAMKFNCARRNSRASSDDREDESNGCCRCTCYRKVDENGKSVFSVNQGASSSTEGSSEGSVHSDAASSGDSTRTQRSADHESADSSQSGIYGTANSDNLIISVPFIDAQWMRTIHEDCDEAARIARAREIEQGVDPPANFRSVRRLQLLCSNSAESENSQSEPPRRLQLVCPPDLSVESLRALFQNHVTLRSCPLDARAGCHTQVDFIHCLVPDLQSITNCSFYWGKMDRYEAERLLENKPEGTFLLRDSAQEEFLFSVSFRKYGRSLHARIEQWNHKFSFDCHDPGVYTSETVCGLIEHYKDPASCMFFEPVLTWPLHRNFTFSLQHLARASIVNKLTYDNINHLNLPKSLKSYLKEYHYRQKVRVERFDDDVQWLEVRNVSP